VAFVRTNTNVYKYTYKYHDATQSIKLTGNLIITSAVLQTRMLKFEAQINAFFYITSWFKGQSDICLHIRWNLSRSGCIRECKAM